MVGVVVATHGKMAGGMINSADMLVGLAEQLKAVAIFPGEAPETFDERVAAALDEVETGAGVVALVDIFGGTPFNTVYRVSRGKRNVKIVTGVNLPMLLSVITEREEETTQQELVDQLLEVGKDQIRAVDL